MCIRDRSVLVFLKTTMVRFFWQPSLKSLTRPSTSLPTGTSYSPMSSLARSLLSRLTPRNSKLIISLKVSLAKPLKRSACWFKAGKGLFGLFCVEIKVSDQVHEFVHFIWRIMPQSSRSWHSKEIHVKEINYERICVMVCN